MKPSRIVFPGFWFGKSDLSDAVAAAKRGVGGFCVYGGTAQETARFVQTVRDASAYDHLLICADIQENLTEVVPDAPALPSNAQLGTRTESDGAYRKGLLSARLARSAGIDWLLAPVVDVGYQSPCFGEEPAQVARLCGEYAAGMANGGVLNCIKYFPGVSGILKPLTQLEETEFITYKGMFRLADAVMPSDMVFSNLDAANRAMMSERVVTELLKKRLNYKGCVVSTPLFKSRIKNEAEAVLKMMSCGVNLILAPQNAQDVMDAVEKAAETEHMADKVVYAVSNLELLIGKAMSFIVPDLPWDEVCAQARAMQP